MRKAAVYLHNLTTILADGGTLGEPSKLKYSIPRQPATVHDLLLQKARGTFELVVWGELVKGSEPITVRPGGACPSVNVFDPTVGTTATQLLRTVDSVKLTRTDHPVILEMDTSPGARRGDPRQGR
jgi:hypothetical protein